MGEFDTLNTVFARLDDWRHLPNYQLERRADIFFAIYLPSFLQDYLKIPLRPQLVPEFPLHLPTLGLRQDNRSVKADYLAVAEDLSKAFLIELKTDMNSHRDEQQDYLNRAKHCDIRLLLEGITTICAATNAQSKYCHLLRLLEQVGLIDLPTNLKAGLAKGKSMPRDDLRSVVVRPGACKVEVLFLQPEKTSADTIGFAEFAQWLGRFTDPLTVRFRESLTKWSVPC
jgi:hypothetical protein